MNDHKHLFKNGDVTADLKEGDLGILTPEKLSPTIEESIVWAIEEISAFLKTLEPDCPNHGKEESPS